MRTYNFSVYRQRMCKACYMRSDQVFPFAVTVHVFPSVVSPAAVRVNQHGLRKAPVILSYVTYSTCRDACNENTQSRLHVIM